eukprot:2098733-Lingulodinium_polyedra.AAC.1
MRRYEAAGRLQQVMARLPASVRARCPEAPRLLPAAVHAVLKEGRGRRSAGGLEKLGAWCSSQAAGASRK